MGSFNTAISFVTNTNWQWYSGEVSISHLTQMLGLSVQNFVSAAVGRWPGSNVALLVAIVPAAAFATILGSVFVSVAIAIVEGGLRARLVGELRLSYWMAPMNALVAAAVAAEQVLDRAVGAARDFANLHRGAHAASKLRARSEALQGIRAGIENMEAEFGVPG